MTSNTLFIGNLSYSTDENKLREHFTGCTAARIASSEGRSRGFGYVEFATPEAAQAAMNAASGSEIDGRPIKIDFATERSPRPQRSPQVNNPPSNTLFVANLSFEATQRQVEDAFRPYNVRGVRLMTDRETGRPRGFAYAEFATVEDAQAALQAMNGADISGRNLRLDFAQSERRSPQARTPQGPKNPPSNTLFIGGLAYTATEDNVRQAFANCGEIKSVRLMERDGVSKGFGYIEFPTVEAAQAAMALNGATIDGRAVRLDFAEARQERPARSPVAPAEGPKNPPSNKLFVGQLDFAATQGDLNAAFGRFGTITDVHIVMDKMTRRPKGFGYVTFQTVEQATAAMQAMNGVQIRARPVRIDFAGERPERPERPVREPRPDRADRESRPRRR